MDTRNKILTLDAARRLSMPLTVVATSNTVLRAAFVEELEALRRPGRALLVLVLPATPELLTRRARAELLAGLYFVDFVALAEPDALHGFEVIRLESRDAELIGRIRENDAR